MIPSFPAFKKVEKLDRTTLSAFLPAQPYSDYNFTNLWCWDLQQQRKLSVCNGNLVVLFTDYTTNKKCLSFCGTKKPVSTAKALIAYAEKEGIDQVLKYVPGVTAARIQSSKLTVARDKENDDYIFSTQQIAQARGSRFKKKRQLANRFIKENPEAIFTIADHTDRSIQQHVLHTMERWYNKKKGIPKESYQRELQALTRLLHDANTHNIILSTIYLNDQMLAFSIDEKLPKKFALSHFLKADISYVGVYEYLNQMTAAYLHTNHITYWNWEQDLNIEGLRTLKLSYRPVRFLQKFRVSLVL